MKEVKKHKVRIIPAHIETEVDGKTKKVPVYERTSKPSERARAAGYVPDKFFHLEVQEISDFKLGGNPKPFTLSVFKTTHSALFSALAEELSDESNFIKLNTDDIIVLNERLPGRIAERKCKPFFGTEPKADGSLQIRYVRKKQKDGSYVQEPMINNSLKFFLFEHEATDPEQEEIAFNKEYRRRAVWSAEGEVQDEGEAPETTKEEPKITPTGEAEAPKAETKEPADAQPE